MKSNLIYKRKITKFMSYYCTVCQSSRNNQAKSGNGKKLTYICSTRDTFYVVHTYFAQFCLQWKNGQVSTRGIHKVFWTLFFQEHGNPKVTLDISIGTKPNYSDFLHKVQSAFLVNIHFFQNLLSSWFSSDIPWFLFNIIHIQFHFR